MVFRQLLDKFTSCSRQNLKHLDKFIYTLPKTILGNIQIKYLESFGQIEIKLRQNEGNLRHN